MNTFYTKCGRSFKKFTKAETTGYQMAQQNEADGSLGRVMDIECQKCPFVVDVKEGWPARHKRYECRAGSKPPNHQSDWIGSLDDKCSIYVRSLDHDLCDRIISYCKENPYLAAAYNQDRSDCRRTVSISCTANKKGVAAKKEVIKTFFPGIAVAPDPTNDPDDPAYSMTEERRSMGKFSVDDIMESAQKIAEKAEGLEPVPEFKEIRCSLVDFNPENVFAKKDTDETIAELADDIETNGLLHPIVVNHVGGRYRLISGERRFKAITSVLQWQVIQANVYEGLDQFGEIKRLYAANYQVRQYTAAESLSHYQHLTQLLFDKSHDDAISTKQKKKIAEMLNVSGRQVNKYARICQDLSADELQAIAENRMSINQADALAGSRMETPKKPSSALHKQEPVPKQQQKVSSVGSQKITEVSAHTSPLPSSPLLEKQELVPEKANQESVPVPPVPIPHDTLGFNESTAADVVRQIEEITTGLYLLSDMLKKSGVDMGNTIDKFIETMHEYQHEYHDQVNAGK